MRKHTLKLARHTCHPRADQQKTPRALPVREAADRLLNPVETLAHTIWEQRTSGKWANSSPEKQLWLRTQRDLTVKLHHKPADDVTDWMMAERTLKQTVGAAAFIAWLLSYRPQ